NGFGNGVLRPVLTSQITQAVGRHEQGIALGISGSLSSLAMAVAPPSGGAMLNLDWTFAWALVASPTAAPGLVATPAAREWRRPVESAAGAQATGLSSAK